MPWPRNKGVIMLLGLWKQLCSWGTSHEEPGGKGTVGSTSHTLAKKAFGGTWGPGDTCVVEGNRAQVKLVRAGI